MVEGGGGCRTRETMTHGTHFLHNMNAKEKRGGEVNRRVLERLGFVLRESRAFTKQDRSQMSVFEGLVACLE